MALTTDPQRALQGAHSLVDAQQQWRQMLEASRPNVPIGAFGTGLQGKAARLLSLVQQGHDVRMAHARRMGMAGVDGAALVRRVEQADGSNATSFAGRAEE